MTRLRGRCAKGKRLHAHAPHGHWRTTTMISSARMDGSSACMTIEGATDAAVFHIYTKEDLCPTLRPADTVIMDKLGAHKSASTIALIEQCGARVECLPAYSPELNPIEMMWSKLKASLRDTQARTHEALLAAIDQGLRNITSKDASHWFAHCGYNFI